MAQSCLDASHNGTITFPEVVRRLTAAGFEGYIVDFRQNTRTYFLPDCSNTALPMPPTTTGVAPAFNSSGIAAAVRDAQANAPGFTFQRFCENVRACGCAGYIVSFLGKRVVYFGRTAETHVELFPQ